MARNFKLYNPGCRGVKSLQLIEENIYKKSYEGLDLLHCSYQLVKTCQMFSDIFYEGKIFLSTKQTKYFSADLMSDPESVAKWLQIRDNSLKLLSLGENPGIEKYFVN